VNVHLSQFVIPAIASLLAVCTSYATDVAFVGVTANDLTPERAATLKTGHGAEIATVTPDSPAAKAGVREKDVVVSFNGQSVEDAKGLTALIRQTPAGALVKLDVIRGDNQGTVVQVQTTARPPNPVKDYAASVGETLGIQAILTGLACAVDLALTGGAFRSTLVSAEVASAPATAIGACASGITHR
jgi:membrane-associated protease RseP (regulator of RpoE activity)